MTDEIKRAAGLLLMTRSSPRQFLLMRHRRRWDLPKGHCESGETDLQTALRETEEETGIPTDLIDVVPDFRFELKYPVTYKRHGDRVFQKHVVYLIGMVDSTFDIQVTEHESYQWFHWTSPPQPIQAETIDPLLAAADEFLKG